jgi:site-specific DNA recombinase
VRRPEFERLLEDLEAGLLAGVICWKLDRLTRSHRDFERLWEMMERRGAKLVSLHEQFDTSTPAGEFSLRMMVGMARMESQNIALRLRSRLAEKRDAGEPHTGGYRPYGYRSDFVTVDQGEAQVIREGCGPAARWRGPARGHQDLNRRGLLSSTGKPWSPPTLRRTLASPRLAGLRVHWRNEPTAAGKVRRIAKVVGPGTWEPILDQATHEALVALFEDPARRSQTRQARVHLLAGLLRCGRCGGPMYAQSHGTGRPKDYRCLAAPVGRGCGGVSIHAGALEELVTQAAIAAVDGPELRPPSTPRSTTRARPGWPPTRPSWRSCPGTTTSTGGSAETSSWPPGPAWRSASATASPAWSGRPGARCWPSWRPARRGARSASLCR